MKPTALFTNDDGVRSPLLKTLAAELADLFAPAIVAPAEEMSWASAMHVCTREVRVTSVPDEPFPTWAVTGSPVDCVHLAIQHLGLQPALTLSGVNYGLNAGSSRITFSGTVQAALAAVRLGVPAVAVSIYYPRAIRERHRHAGELAESLYLPEIRSAAAIVRALWRAGCLRDDACANINLPHPSPDPGRVRFGRVWKDGQLALFEPLAPGRFAPLACYPDFTGVDEESDMGLVARGLIAVSALATDHEDASRAARFTEALVPLL